MCKRCEEESKHKEGGWETGGKMLRKWVRHVESELVM